MVTVRGSLTGKDLRHFLMVVDCESLNVAIRRSRKGRTTPWNDIASGERVAMSSFLWNLSTAQQHYSFRRRYIKQRMKRDTFVLGIRN